MPPITAHMSNVMCLEMDPKGKYFATGSADALVGLWDASEMVCLRVSVETRPHSPPPKPPKATEKRRHARPVRETPREVVCCYRPADRDVRRLPHLTLQTLNCSDYPVKCLSFSFDGQLLAAASEDQSLKLVSGDPTFSKFLDIPWLGLRWAASLTPARVYMRLCIADARRDWRNRAQARDPRRDLLRGVAPAEPGAGLCR